MLAAYLEEDDILRDRYKIIGLIDTGGMGAIYLAQDMRLEGRQCAIKETLPLPTLNQKAIEMFRKQFYQEASTLARLDHPGLPKVSDYFSVSERDYLVMDYVSGQNLLEIVNEARREDRFLEQMTVLEWMEQLCKTLIYLHSRQPPVLHRDIKPANIKLNPDGHIKLVDFGLVKPLDPDDPNTVSGLQGAGSLPYSPLEQYVDYLGHTDARSDLYALGATLYHLLTGNIPPSAQERFLDPESLRPPREINPHISSDVSEAILAAISPHPKNRPASVAQWWQILDRSLVPVRLKREQDLEEDDWISSLRENWWLIGLAVLLLGASAWMTFGS